MTKAFFRTLIALALFGTFASFYYNMMVKPVPGAQVAYELLVLAGKKAASVLPGTPAIYDFSCAPRSAAETFCMFSTAGTTYRVVIATTGDAPRFTIKGQRGPNGQTILVGADGFPESMPARTRLAYLGALGGTARLAR